jgi:Xaa-Pro aminopeptidase
VTNTLDAVDRGFGPEEFELRLARAQAAMTRDELDALVVTTAPNVRYFTGFNTQFWESPTRPWFIVVPRGSRTFAAGRRRAPTTTGFRCSRRRSPLCPGASDGSDGRWAGNR